MGEIVAQLTLPTASFDAQNGWVSGLDAKLTLPTVSFSSEAGQLGYLVGVVNQPSSDFSAVGGLNGQLVGTLTRPTALFDAYTGLSAELVGRLSVAQAEFQATGSEGISLTIPQPQLSLTGLGYQVGTMSGRLSTPTVTFTANDVGHAATLVARINPLEAKLEAHTGAATNLDLRLRTPRLTFSARVGYTGGLNGTLFTPRAVYSETPVVSATMIASFKRQPILSRFSGRSR